MIFKLDFGLNVGVIKYRMKYIYRGRNIIIMQNVYLNIILVSRV